MILDAILSSTDTVQDSDHATAQVSDQVQRLISAMKQEDYTLAELMQLVGLTHRATFQKNYLNPAIEAGLIERTIPDKPKSPKQRYRLKWSTLGVELRENELNATILINKQAVKIKIIV